MDQSRLRVAWRDETWTLDAPGPHVVGRDETATVQIDDPLVSRRHVVVTWSGGWTAADAGSRNGTFQDGRQVTSVPIGGEVQLRLGDPLTGPAVTITPTADPAPTATDPSASARPAAWPEVLVLGRDAQCDVVLDDVLVSRRHAEVRSRPDRSLELVDLSSHNGTYLNGKRIERAPLAQRDLLSLGQHTFRIGPSGLVPAERGGAPTFAAVGLRVRTASGATLLDDVSFALPESSFLGVVGPSGAGKSTLLGALTGRRPAAEGTVLYGDRDLYEHYEDLHRRIGLVPQDDVVHTELTVARAVEFAAELRFPPDVSRAEREHQVDVVLDELGLQHRRDVTIARLSGGQRKRVSIALELLTRPSLLFLDEPTSGLDPGLERTVMEVLRNLADGGRTVVVVTHAVASLSLCDRVLVLAPGGRTAYFGPPQLAPAHFEHDDFETVFQDLSRPDGPDWQTRFRQHPDHAAYVAEPLARYLAPVEEHAAPPPAKVATHGGWIRQVTTLTRRYAAVLVADRRNLAMLLAQAPLIGLLMLYALPTDELSPPDGQPRVYSLSAVVLFNLVLASTWLGAVSGIREIVKERAIFHRERATGMAASAYLVSKLLVLGALVVVQAVVLVAIATARQGGPTDAVVLGWAKGELMVVIALTGLASLTTAMVVSSLVRTTDMALTVLPMVLILQNVLSTGGIFPSIADKPILKELSYISSSQWGFSAAASTSELNDLQAVTNVLRGVAGSDLRNPAAVSAALADPSRGSRRFDHEPEVWLVDVSALAGLALAGAVTAGLILTRRERHQ